MSEKLLFLVICIASFGASHSFFYNDSALVRGLANRQLFDYYNRFSYNATIDFLRLLTESDAVAPKCKVSLNRWIAGIEHSELWALKFLQSTGKSVNGKLIGRDLNTGSFDFCTAFGRDEQMGIDFDGKYCLVSVHGPDAEEIRTAGGYRTFRKQLSERSQRLHELGMGNAHGVCMPSTCEIAEVAEVFNRLVKPHGFRLLMPDRCTTVSEPEPITSLQIVSILVLASFVLLCILAFFFENDFLSNFYLPDNVATIYSVKPDPNNNTYDTSSILHGVKFGLVAGSIVLHNMGLPMGLFFPQAFGSVKEVTWADWFYKPVSRSYFIIDGMFFLGGFFAFWAWHDAAKSGKVKLNLLYFFGVRYMKVFVIVTIIIMLTFILPLLGSGPFYSQLTNHFVQNCKENFWREYLLVSNEQSVADMCVIPAWFLSADFQVYLANYFVIYYLIVRPKLGFLIAFVQASVFSAFTLFHIHHNKITYFFNFWDINVEDIRIFQDIYLHSFYHYNTYLLGIIGAFVIKKRIRPRILDFAVARLVLAIAALGALPLFLLYLEHLESTGAERSGYFFFFLPLTDKIVNLFMPYFFAYMLLVGDFGGPKAVKFSQTPLRKFFSLRMFVPWSRLSFMLIIGQFIYLIYAAASTRNHFAFDRLTIVKDSISTLFIVFVLGNLMSLVIEQPVFNLFQQYLGIKRRRDIESKIDPKIASKISSKGAKEKAFAKLKDNKPHD